MAKTETMITLELDYVMGYLRHGHLEMGLDNEELEKFKSLSDGEQIYWIIGNGELIVDDYSVEDWDEGSNKPCIHD